MTAGYWLVVGGAVLTVVGALFQLLNRQTEVDAAKRANTNPAITDAMIEQSALIVYAIVLVVVLVLAALAAWFAGKVKAGQKKPRTGLMIAVLIGLFFTLLANGYLGVVGAVIAMGGLVLLYAKQSTEYLNQAESTS